MKIKIWLFILFGLFTGIIQSQAQSISISGEVLDGRNGQPLQGATVSVKGTSLSVMTDAGGRFTLTAVSAGATLTISYVGMIPVSEIIQHAGTFRYTLQPRNADINDVVVIGYGRQSKRQVTTAVATVSSSTIESLPLTVSEQALQGTVAGITVTQNSGSPGAPLTIRLRGTGTAGSAAPLFIVDGLQVPDINYLNPSDISSISILKDAASAAIYGARGGNGVVLVQTKTGRKNVEKPEIALDGYYGFQNLGHTPQLMNRDQYVAYYNQYEKTIGGTVIADSQRIKLPNTNWYKQVFEKNQPVRSGSISISNGGKGFSYYVSGADIKQDGMVGGKEGKSDYERKNFKGSLDADVFKNFSIHIGADLVKSTRNFLDENQANPGVALLNYLTALPPIYPAFDPNHPNIPFNMGDLSNPIVVNGVTLPAVGAVTNPFIALTLDNNRTISYDRVYNISATWKPLTDLSITSSYADYEDNSVTKNFSPAYDYRPIQNFFNTYASLTQTNSQASYSQWEGNAKYNVSRWADHKLEALAGFSVLRSSASSTAQSGTNFYVNTIDQANFALIKDPTTIVNATPSAYETGLLSYYGRLNYAYQEKYLLAATVRSDASSLFGPDNRTGIFPSVSAGWVASQESFLHEVSWLDLLKVRASWGVNGNNFINPYQYSTIVDPNSGPSFGGLNTPGISIPYLSNPNVKWEKVTQTDIGVDLNLFQNALGITVDYYEKKNSDILVPVGTPMYTGYSSAAANVASVKNSGVEFLVSYRKKYADGFGWNFTANLGTVKNRVTSLGNNGQPINGGSIGYIFNDPITRTDIGHPIASFYGFKLDHLDANGNFVFKDLNKDGQINDLDKTYIGSPFPNFTYGTTLGVSYKGFDLSAFLYGSYGNKIYNATVRLDASFTNRPASYAQPGAPKNLLGGGTGDVQTDVSDYYVESGSFAKLKTLSLGYSLPDAVLKKVKLSGLRVYVSGQNLFVITKYSGVDPEIGQASTSNTLDIGIDRGFYPQPKLVLFGIQAKF